jgi:hypothetical protein
MRDTMNSAATTGYDTAIKLIDDSARTIWSTYTAFMLTNTLLVSLLTLLKALQFMPFIAILIGGFGAVVCLLWLSVTMRNFDYYRYYFAWARKFEEDAFGESVKMVRGGEKFAGGEPCTIATPPFRMRSGSFIRVERLIEFVIVMFFVIYLYLLFEAGKFVIGEPPWLSHPLS